MRRILLFTSILLTVILVFVGCDVISGIIGGDKTEHIHIGGDATCSSGAICDECGKTYGEAAAHTYSAATCTEPAICTVCGATDGSPAEHTYSAATCTEPATCTVCGATDGTVAKHSYSTATCISPAICTVCGFSDGILDSHAYAPATCTEPKRCTVCGDESGAAAGHIPLSPVEENKVAPKCDVDGKYDSVVYCAECSTELERVEDVTIDALGHIFVAANCTEPKKCTVCGYREGDVAHSYGNVYSHNEQAHWTECSLCGAKGNVGEHVGGEMTDTERAKCDVCSAYYGEAPEFTVGWTIEALTPQNGSTFCLANSRIEGWYENYDYKTTDTDAHWLEEDIFLPECPTFTWSVGEIALYYKLYISENADMSEAECYLTSSTSVTVEHLYTSTTYYWFVDAVFGGYTVRSEIFHFSTEESPRTVDVEGVSNVRDLGGYVTEDGKVIKQGLIYRSAKLDDITELGEYTLLYILGVKTDLDLRGYEQNAPIEELNYVPVACPWYSTGSNHIWLNDYNKEEFAKAIKVFADPNNYPIIFHCSLGRDRTGTLAMVLGGLLGLDENTLMMEYELSVFSYWGTNGTTKYNEGLRNNIHNTYLYIYNNYNGDSFSEKVENFLLEIGVTAEEINSIKSIMLEEVE